MNIYMWIKRREKIMLRKINDSPRVGVTNTNEFIFRIIIQNICVFFLLDEKLNGQKKNTQN